MSLRSHYFLFTLALLLNFFILGLCVDKSPLSAPQAMLMEDKIRLGSTPPSCHNRCNTCNPCTAVQVPTLPGRRAGATDAKFVDQSAYSQYSNYKPLGWKCRCRDRLYNP